MKKFKIILSTASLVFLTFSIILFSACDKGKTKYNDSTLTRPCDNVICLNGGACNDGLCYCPQGFEGSQCQTRWSDKFVGNYIVDDACDTSSQYYNAAISPDPNYAYKLKLYNIGLFCPGAIIDATINPEKTSFNIPTQKTCGDLYISGYGNLSGNFVNIYFTTRDTVLHTGNNCSLVLNRKP